MANGDVQCNRAIPQFYTRAPDDDNDLQVKLREEARSLLLQQKSKDLLSNVELKVVWNLLEHHFTPPLIEDDGKMISYTGFKKVKAEAPDKAKVFFTPTLFANLQQKDRFGRIAILDVFNYIMRKTWLRQSRIGLSLYDPTGQGYLTEKDLELYVEELFPTLNQLSSLDEAFHSFYICTAVRKFLFFLDPLRQGRIRIVDILASGFLDDIIELREANNPDGTPRAGADSSNWFSPDSALKVYAQFLNLDEDRNGLLSKKELKRFNMGSLTGVFVSRIFQECLTYQNEMDYKAYLDFILAQENKKDPAALQYFFRLLDVRHLGYLDAYAINFFFKAIQTELEDNDQEYVSFEDIKDEIFDMVKPGDPLKITLKDLVNSGLGDTVVDILTDYVGFINYENRELLATEDDEEEEDSEHSDPTNSDQGQKVDHLAEKPGKESSSIDSEPNPEALPSDKSPDISTSKEQDEDDIVEMVESVVEELTINERSENEPESDV